jgi:hypothetical protein
MATSNIYITPSTSLILIKSLAKPTFIYLSTFNVPDFRVNIRDTTGSLTLQTTPINISTVGGAKFIDNTSYYAIDKPYGFLNLSLRNSTIWQILHTSGQAPAQAAANVGVTGISTMYIGLLSTAVKNVSSATIENLETPNSIILTGPFVVGNLSTPGFVLLQSTLNVSHNATFEKSLFVSGSTILQSSLSVESIQPLSSFLRVISSIGVGGSINVSGFVTVFSTLNVQSSLQVQSLFVTKSTTEATVYIRDLFQTSTNISSLGGLDVQGTLLVQNNLFVTHAVSTLNGSYSTNTLNIGGLATVFSNVSTLSSATFFSSMSFYSTLNIQTYFSTLSSANVKNVVSTSVFLTDFLSSSTSFSTNGDFTILSTLTVGGTLSANQLFLNGLFSVGKDFVSMKDISTFGSTRVSTLTVGGSALVNQVNVNSSIGVGTDGYVDGSVLVNSAFYNGPLVVGKNLSNNTTASFETNVAVQSNIRVRGNMTVGGTAFINSFNVQSYTVNDLQITASSPLVALRASTLSIQSTLVSDTSRLSYDPLSGNVVLQISSTSQYPSQFVAGTTYAKRFMANYLSTYSLYTDAVLNQNTTLPLASQPKFELLTNAAYLRGLSTPMVVGVDISGNEYRGKFIGSAELLSNVPLRYTNISAATLTASTVVAKAISSFKTNTLNASFESFLSMTGGLYFAAPAAFLSSSAVLDRSLLLTLSNNEFIQPVNNSVLNVTNTLFLDSANSRVGVLTSTPQYDLDIRGSLYYSGTLNFQNQATILRFSTQKDVVSFSTIFYSSIAIRDELQIPTNTLFPISSFLGFSTDPGNPNKQFLLGERKLPYTVNTQLNIYSGVYTNSNYSTIDINYILFAYNNTRNVGIGTVSYTVDINGNPSETAPVPPPSEIDLVVDGDFQGTEIQASTMNITTKLLLSTLTMPNLAIDPLSPSTINTMKLTYSSYTYNTELTVDDTVTFFKDYTLEGSLHVKKPTSASYGQSLFCVYSDAYISSVTVNSLHATSILLGTQDL